MVPLAVDRALSADNSATGPARDSDRAESVRMTAVGNDCDSLTGVLVRRVGESATSIASAAGSDGGRIESADCKAKEV